MNKNTILISSLFCIGININALCQNIEPTLHDPTTWDAFVQEAANIQTMDTFVIQSFEGTENPFWTFEDIGQNTPMIVNASQWVSNQKGNKSLQLKGDCQIRFEWEKPAGYDSQVFAFYLAAQKVSTGGSFIVQAIKGNTTEKHYEIKVTKSNYNLDFGQTFQHSGPATIRNRIYIGSTNNMTIITKNSGTDGAFFIDYMTICGTIKRYSLFRGEGKWEDVQNWTHRPVYRNRHALIQGNVSINNDIKCNHLHLANGSVSISSGSVLKNNQTFLQAPGSAVYASGEWEMKQAGVYKNFPEKDRWYFVSFPFDVYKTDIDPAFELKDETTDLSDNYFYALTYDGEKRSYSNTLGNWKVVPEDYPDHIPLFERGKGYLIALDKKAAASGILFSSQTGKELVWDALDYQKYMEVPLKNSQMENEHHGWILCGNPFPSPLPVKNITVTDQSDGFLYYFNGEGYKVVSLKGDFVLPPYSAFFLKVTNSCTIRFKPPAGKPSGNYLPENMGVVMPGEPQPNPLFPDSSQSGSRLHFRVRDNQLYLNNLPDNGEVLICNISGTIVLTQVVSKGNSSISLNLPKGVYLLSIRTGNEQTQEKFILY